MADEGLRVLERRAIGGDPQARKRLERHRCRVGEHCGCRVDTSELIDDHWLSLIGLNEYGNMATGALENADSDVVIGRITFEVKASDRELLMGRLLKLCDKLSVQGPPAANVIDRPCPYCKAVIGKRCMTAGGNLAKDWHVDRKSPPGIRVVDDRYEDFGDYDYHYGW